MAESLELRVLMRAADIVGGRRTLAERLGVPVKSLEKWLAGKGPVPREALLAAVEIIIDDLDADGGLTDPADPPPPRVSSTWSPKDRD